MFTIKRNRILFTTDVSIMFSVVIFYIKLAIPCDTIPFFINITKSERCPMQLLRFIFSKFNKIQCLFCLSRKK